jgi:hypothetical protein
MKKIFHYNLSLFAGTVSLAQSPGFFLDAWEERVAVIPVSEPETKPASDPTVTITVDVMDTLNKIPKWIFGNNAVTWDNMLRINSERVICLNYRYARYGTGPDPAAAAAHMAAEWVLYDKGRIEKLE